MSSSNFKEEVKSVAIKIVFEESRTQSLCGQMRSEVEKLLRSKIIFDSSIKPDADYIHETVIMYENVKSELIGLILGNKTVNDLSGEMRNAVQCLVQSKLRTYGERSSGDKVVELPV